MNNLTPFLPQKVVLPLKSERRRYIITILPQVCVYCGATDNLTVDHILARTLGGRNTEENFQMLCRTCNQAKSIDEQRTLGRLRIAVGLTWYGHKK